VVVITRSGGQAESVILKDGKIILEEGKIPKFPEAETTMDLQRTPDVG
jgi:hypothetical protein